MNKKSIQETLWMSCLLEMYNKNQKEGKQHLNFTEVDSLVIEKSKKGLVEIKPYEVRIE